MSDCDERQKNGERKLAGRPLNREYEFVETHSNGENNFAKMHSNGERESAKPQSNGDSKLGKEQKSGEGELGEIRSASSIIGDASLKIAIAAGSVGFKELQLLFIQTSALMKRAEEVASREAREILASDAGVILPATITWTFAGERREAHSKEESSSSG